MNAPERNARMMVAINLMAEVIQDVKVEADKDGKKLSNREIWDACGMPMAIHDTQVVDFITKQRFGFINSTTTNGNFGQVENSS